MAIKGSLKEASLPDVIQLLFLGRRTGCLSLADGRKHASIYFDEGWITHAAIVNRRDRLGDMLVKAGMVTVAQLEQAIAFQDTMRGRKVGEILVSLGAITREELVRYVRLQVEEGIYTLFSWATGTFSFEAGVRPDVEDVLARINPESLLLEGARRIDEWSLIEKKIPGFDLIFGVDRTRLPETDLTFSEAQRRILPLLDGARDVRQVVDDSGLSDFVACQAMFGLLTAGLAHRVGTSATAAQPRAQEMQIEEHRNLGVAFYRTGMLDEALREFRRVVELRPSEGGAPFYLGLIALRQGRWQDAIDALRQAADRSGPRAAILHNLAVALELLGRVDQAEGVYAEAAGRAPDDGRVALSWGILALKRGEPDVAVVRLSRARDLFGTKLPAIWYWAASQAHGLLGDLETALEISKAGVGAFPGDAVVRNNLAVLLEASGDGAGAEALLRQALAEEPGIPQISKNLGDIYYRTRRYDDAREAFTRAVKLNPDLGEDLYFKLGNLAFKRKDTEAARACWERATTLNPGHQLARANLDTLPEST